MQTASRVLTCSALALGIVAALTAGRADATGFQLRENSVQNLGRANAGTAVAWGDASVVLNNPAAMSNFDTTTLQADVTVIDLTADFNGGGITAVGTPLNGGDGGDPGDAATVPAMAVVVPLGGALDNVTLGASVSAPFGLKTEYDAGWVGRYNAVTSDLKTVDVTFSAAIAFSDKVSVGAGIIYQHSDVTLSNAIDFGTALCAGSGDPANCFNPLYPFQPQGADGLVEVEGDDNDWGFVFGAQYKVSDNFVLGYSHRTEIHHTLDGGADFSMPADVAATFAALGIHDYDDGTIWANLDTPATDTISARWDVNADFRVMADLQFTGWSSLEQVAIYRTGGAPLGPPEAFDWDDTTYYSLGGEWDLSDAFTLRAGIAHDESPTNDLTRTPRLPDNDRMLYSLGMTWNASPALSIDAAYQRIEIDDPGINVFSSSGSLLTGDFSGYANLFGVAARYRF